MRKLKVRAVLPGRVAALMEARSKPKENSDECKGARGISITSFAQLKNKARSEPSNQTLEKRSFFLSSGPPSIQRASRVRLAGDEQWGFLL